MKMIQQLKEAWKLEDLRKRMRFMLLAFSIFMVGRMVPLAQIDAGALQDRIGTDDLLGILNMFSGGAMRKMSIFALGVMPYINASIMFQLLTVAVPSLKKKAQEGEHGRQEIAKWTRLLTVALALFQSYGFTMLLQSLGAGAGLSAWGRLEVMLTLTAGSMFLLWLGEQLTEHGIGNGVSLIIFVGIMSELPSQIWNTFKLAMEGGTSFFSVFLLLLLLVLTVVMCIVIQQGERQIRVQYARRVVGTRMMGGASTHLPIKVNSAGVMPIIFAISVVLFPQTIMRFAPVQQDWWIAVRNFVDAWLTPSTSRTGWFALLLYFGLVVAFTYFYTAVTHDPAEISDNLKKNGGQIKGIRAGAETTRYIDRVLTRVTFAGALFLGLIALMQYLVPWITGVQTFSLVGGTSLLIVVGVALDTMQQIDAHLLMRQYKGFID
ncbi:MAG: preprotein translocase subunit SecY [Fimbriimonadaceae bacterium]|nr:preprotein translocase subunit SecY [Fimbriimonadaceae bacterium]